MMRFHPASRSFSRFAGVFPRGDMATASAKARSKSAFVIYTWPATELSMFDHAAVDPTIRQPTATTTESTLLRLDMIPHLAHLFTFVVAT
jgi:hypothetical protein